MANKEKTSAELYREERKKRLAKAAKRNAKGSMSEKTQKTIVYTITVLIFIGIIGAITGGLVKNTGLLERNKTVMTIGDTEIDKYEYIYFYSNLLQQVASQSASYDMYYGTGAGAMYTGYDYSKTPAEQSYTLGEVEGVENPTYDDFFKMYAIDQLKYTKACLDYAKENGIELTQEEIDEKVDGVINEIKANIQESVDQAKEQGQAATKMSLATYLRSSYGSGMTVKLFRRILTENAIVQKIQEVKTEELAASYEMSKIEETFLDEIDTYGVVTLRNYVINAETGEADEEGNVPAPTEEALAQAKAKAEAFAAKVTDEASFKQAAADMEKEAGNDEADDLLTDDSITLIENEKLSEFADDEDLSNWVSSADTKAGATYILEKDTGYTVYLMVDPVHKAPEAAESYDVRHILIKFPEDDAEKATDGDAKETEVKEIDFSKYDVTVENNVEAEITDVECYNEALSILESYLEGDKTEDAFAELAKEHSADGNAAEGGIYEDTPLGQMVAPFENWATDLSRKKGDVGIVETTYGYHIMYFIGAEVSDWESSIRDDLAAADFTTFAEELRDNEAYNETVVEDEFANADAKIVELAKNLADNYARQMNQSYSF
ncbi:MAG: peptidylprolyl isomerase [Acutalibacteraceae bacterium]